MPSTSLLRRRVHHERLTTQNLLVSAGFFEHTSGIARQTLADLTALIDLYCLYDRIIVLGRGPGALAPSRFIDNIRRDVIVIENVTLSNAENAANSAAMHLAACLTRDRSARRPSQVAIRRVIESMLQQHNVTSGLTFCPDTPRDFSAGMKRLKTLSPAAVAIAESRSYEFARRSFLYLGYAETTGRILVPDLARVPLMEGISHDEGLFREQLLAQLRKAWERQSRIDPVGMTRVVPALASIVFDRASPDRRRIAREMQNLRDELKPLRQRLRESEAALNSALAPEGSQEETKWKAAFKELAKSFGGTQRIVRAAPVLDMTSDIVDVASDPTNPLKWASTLAKAPIEMVQRFVARRRVIELHRLGRRMPAPTRLQGSMRELFGEIE